jgi:hypothetical protein
MTADTITKKGNEAIRALPEKKNVLILLSGYAGIRESAVTHSDLRISSYGFFAVGHTPHQYPSPIGGEW